MAGPETMRVWLEIVRAGMLTLLLAPAAITAMAAAPTPQAPAAPAAAPTPQAAAAPPAALPLRLPSFDALAAQAAQTVQIQLDPSMLGLAASFLDSGDPQDAAVKDIVRGLKGVYVRSYTFKKDFAYPAAEVETLRKQLPTPPWQRIVGVHDSEQHSNVDIYICADQGHANGLVIIASEPRQFTIVNIVGAIDLRKLHSLEGKFGIPPLRLDPQK